MEYQKITNLLDTTSVTFLVLLLKNGLKFMISLVMQKIDINLVIK